MPSQILAAPICHWIFPYGQDNLIANGVYTARIVPYSTTDGCSPGQFHRGSLGGRWPTMMKKQEGPGSSTGTVNTDQRDISQKRGEM